MMGTVYLISFRAGTFGWMNEQYEMMNEQYEMMNGLWACLNAETQCAFASGQACVHAKSLLCRSQPII